MLGTLVKDKRKIYSFEQWYYRKLLGISWTDKKVNEYILNRVGRVNRILCATTRKNWRLSDMHLRKIVLVNTY